MLGLWACIAHIKGGALGVGLWRVTCVYSMHACGGTGAVPFACGSCGIENCTVDALLASAMASRLYRKIGAFFCKGAQHTRVSDVDWWVCGPANTLRHGRGGLRPHADDLGQVQGAACVCADVCVLRCRSYHTFNTWALACKLHATLDLRIDLRIDTAP